MPGRRVGSLKSVRSNASGSSSSITAVKKGPNVFLGYKFAGKWRYTKLSDKISELSAGSVLPNKNPSVNGEISRGNRALLFRNTKGVKEVVVSDNGCNVILDSLRIGPRRTKYCSYILGYNEEMESIGSLFHIGNFPIHSQNYSHTKYENNYLILENTNGDATNAYTGAIDNVYWENNQGATITNAVGFKIGKPHAGDGVTITNQYSLELDGNIKSSNLTIEDAGSLVVDTVGVIALDSGNGRFVFKNNGTEFSAANSAYAGMILGYTAIGIDAASDSYTVTASFAVTDADHKVTFVAPPSGKVEIEVTCPVIAIAQRQLYLGLSDNATYAPIHFPNADDVTNQHHVGDVEIYAFANNLTHKWVVEGLTSGTSYTWWLGAKAEQASRITFHWGGNADGEYAPFIMKATALPTTIHDGS
tara:strand:+ start:4878 stop:6131 length:1254 start_codon:yes stop_codon:yes gene_type:complete